MEKPSRPDPRVLFKVLQIRKVKFAAASAGQGQLNEPSNSSQFKRLGRGRLWRSLSPLTSKTQKSSWSKVKGTRKFHPHQDMLPTWSSLHENAFHDPWRLQGWTDSLYQVSQYHSLRGRLDRSSGQGSGDKSCSE